MIRRFNNYLKEYSKRVLTHFRTHSFRINVLNEVTEKGGIKVASQVANHSSINTTQLYLIKTLDVKAAHKVMETIIKP